MAATRTALLLAAIGAVIFSVVALAAPLWHAGFPAGHDAGAHLTYTHLFDRALRAGQFPVRWVELPGGGRSQPLFNFYQPGFYYLVSLTHLVQPSLSASLKLTIAGLWWLGAWFTFLWLKRDGVMPAALGALLFACAPYLILDVFVRAAYPEMAAIAFSPAVLWAIDRFLRTQAIASALALAVFVGLMLVCHLPTVLICTPALVFYACCVPRQREEASGRAWKGLAGLAGLAAAALLGCGLAAFYVLPALLEIKLIAMSQLTSGYFDYHQHFVYPRQWLHYAWGYGGSIPGAEDSMSFQIGPLQWIALLGSLVAIVVLRERRRAVWGWLGVAGLAMFLMTGASVHVWDVVKPLEFIQFPWRFLMLIALASAALASLLLSRLHRYPIAQAIIVLVAAAVMWPLVQPQLKPVRYLPWSDYPIDDAMWAMSEGAAANGFIEVGYSPASVTRFPTGTVGRWINSDGAVREVAAADDRLELVARSPANGAGGAAGVGAAGMRLTITSHAFPGWKVWVDRQETPFAIEPDTGYIQVDVPPGTHRVEARLTNTPVRTAANAISAVSLLVAAGTALYLARQAAPNRRKSAPLLLRRLRLG